MVLQIKWYLWMLLKQYIDLDPILTRDLGFDQTCPNIELILDWLEIMEINILTKYYENQVIFVDARALMSNLLNLT